MKKHLKTFLLTIPTLGLLLSFSGSKELKVGKKMPLSHVKMTNVDDKQYSLGELMGDKGLVVIFSCNTCPFVVGGGDFPGWEKDYNNIHEEARKAGFEVVLVNSNEAKRENDDSLDKMKERAKTQNYTMKYLVDSNSAIADAFGAKTTPHVYVFDATEKLLYKGSIDNSWDNKRTQDEAYLTTILAELAKGEKASHKDTPPRGCSIKRVKLD